MNYVPPKDPGSNLDSASRHSFGYTLAGSALVALATVVAVLAVTYPVIAIGVAALTGATWYAVRTFRRFYRTRRKAGWTRKVCVPKTGVCVEV